MYSYVHDLLLGLTNTTKKENKMSDVMDAPEPEDNEEKPAAPNVEDTDEENGPDEPEKPYVNPWTLNNGTKKERDVCDRCGFDALVVVTFATEKTDDYMGELLFCKHHFDVHEDALEELLDYEITDERKKIPGFFTKDELREMRREALDKELAA